MKCKDQKHCWHDPACKPSLNMAESAEFYDRQLMEEMNSIAAMLERSQQEGLQCEVVLQFAHEVKTKPIPEACYHALEEWIK